MVRKQGCVIFMVFGGLEGLYTSILNPLYFCQKFNIAIYQK